MNIQELQEKHPEAYQALPECYQADDCLEFYSDSFGLYASPLPDQVAALGHWEAMFFNGQWDATDYYGIPFKLS